MPTFKGELTLNTRVINLTPLSVLTCQVHTQFLLNGWTFDEMKTYLVSAFWKIVGRLLIAFDNDLQKLDFQSHYHNDKLTDRDLNSKVTRHLELCVVSPNTFFNVCQNIHHHHNSRFQSLGIVGQFPLDLIVGSLLVPATILVAPYPLYNSDWEESSSC